MSQHDHLNRRAFLREAGALTLVMALTPEMAEAQEKPAAEAPKGPPVPCAVIGTGVQGRDLIARLLRQGNAPVVAICDTDPINLNRGKQAAPQAQAFPDYRQLLEAARAAQAVFVATPTHTHRPIVEAALQAGKHVYCEAPLAHTVADAQAIAKAAQGAKTLFQGGLQNRANPQHLHVLKFIRTGVLGKVIAQGRLQFHRKMSWRRAASTPERERRLNWRLDKDLSLGLVGEIGIHQVDVASWFLKDLPVSVIGFGSVMKWKDGRQVPDTVQCIFEYPNQVRVLYDATLANSFDGSYELFMGDDNAVLIRDLRAWMFKEADAPLLGWEVYAKKDQIGDETGIALVADATKILQMGKIPGKDGSTLDPGKDPLYYALEDFVQRIRSGQRETQCGPLEALQATVVAIKANEAVQSGSRVVFQADWFKIA